MEWNLSSLKHLTRPSMISHKYFSDLISYLRANQACSCPDPELRRALHLVQCSTDAVLKVLISFEPKALHFHFALGPDIMWQAPTPAIQASSCLQTGLTHSHSCLRNRPVAAPSFFWESSLVRGLLGCSFSRVSPAEKPSLIITSSLSPLPRLQSIPSESAPLPSVML